MNQALLAAYKPPGVEPGKSFEAATTATLDGVLFRETAGEVAEEALGATVDSLVQARIMPQISMPKGQMDVEAEFSTQIGQPAHQACVFPLNLNGDRPE